MVNIGAQPPPPPPQGPQGSVGASSAGDKENITRSLGALMKILAGLLAGVNSSILPELRYSEAIAKMFGAVFGITTKGSYPADSWNQRPGVQVANQETMGNFLKAWIFFLAADGKSKPPGVSEKEWKNALAMVKEHPPSASMMADIKKLLGDKAFGTLFTDVLANAAAFATWDKFAQERAGLFKGDARKQYNKLQAEIEVDQQQAFETNPKDRGALEKKIAKLKGEQRGLAQKSGVNMGQYDQLTSQMESAYKARLAIMDKVANVDVPDIQKGRMPKEGTKAKVPSAAEQARYGEITNAGRELSSNADAVLNKWKVMATYYVKIIGKLGPLISKFLKAIEKIAQLVRDKTQS